MRRFLFTLVLLCATYLVAMAHTVIQGKILDGSGGLPLPGALVSVKGTTIGAISDGLGHFTLKTEEKDIYLVITSIGFKTIELKVDPLQQFLTIKMQPATLSLKEIQITPKENSLSTLSKVDVKLRPTQSAQETLRMVPGLFIAQHAGGGKAEQIFLRGFDIDHGTDLQVNVDGLPVNMVSHAHGQGYADLHFLIPELLAKVDFGKGPYYAAHGNFTTAGYVDFKTYNSLPKSMIKVEAGRFNTLRTLAMVDILPKSAKEHAHNAYLAAEYVQTDGPFNSPQNFNRINVMGKYSAMLRKGTFLTTQASTFYSRWDASGQVPVRAIESGLIDRFGAIDDTEGGKTGRTNASVKLSSQVAKKITLDNQAFYSRYYFELYSNFTFFLNDSINGDQIKQREQRDIWGYHGAMHHNTTIGKASLNTTAGLSLRYDRIADNELSRTLNRSTVLNRLAYGDVDEMNISAFVNEKLEAGKWLIDLSARGDFFRFNYADQLDSVSQNKSAQRMVVTPKLNIMYSPSRSIQLYAKTGMGFHSNDARVVVAQEGVDILPLAYGTDIGVIWKPVPDLFIQTAFWYLFLEQEFVYVGDEAIVEPSGKSRRLGFDLSIRYQFTKWLYADVDLNYTLPRAVSEPSDADYIPLAPIFTSIGGLTAKHKSGVNGSLRYRAILDRPANGSNTIIAEGYMILDAIVNYTHKKFEVGVVIENITNAEWNEAQFETESRLRDEAQSVTELHFTPGTPISIRGHVAYFF